MKRIMALLMGIIMLVSVFAGCSNTSPTPADTDAPSSGDNTPANTNGGVTIDENGKRTITNLRLRMARHQPVSLHRLVRFSGSYRGYLLPYGSR